MHRIWTWSASGKVHWKVSPRQERPLWCQRSCHKIGFLQGVEVVWNDQLHFGTFGENNRGTSMPIADFSLERFVRSTAKWFLFSLSRAIAHLSIFDSVLFPSSPSSTRFSRSWLFNLSCPCRLTSQLELGSQVGSTTDLVLLYSSYSSYLELTIIFTSKIYNTFYFKTSA